MLHAKRLIVWMAAVLGILALSFFKSGQPAVLGQQPTGSVPTVTGTPEGPIVTVYQNYKVIHVYAGPSTFDYPAIGILLANETAPAIGRAKDRLDWIQIIYEGVPGSTGWIYGPTVKLSAGAV